MDELDVASTIQVVIAFEDLAMGKRAKQVYDYLTHRLKDFEFEHEVWKFSALECPRLMEAAVRNATAADIIILAMQGHKPLPQHIKTWMEQWVGQHGNPMALVVLFDSQYQSSEEIVATQTYLEDVARRGQMDLFMQPHKGFVRAAEEFYDSEMVPDFEEDYAHHSSTPRWGIND